MRFWFVQRRLTPGIARNRLACSWRNRCRMRYIQNRHLQFAESLASLYIYRQTCGGGSDMRGNRKYIRNRVFAGS